MTTITGTSYSTPVSTTTVVRPNGSIDQIAPVNTNIGGIAQVGPDGTVALIARDPATGTMGPMKPAPPYKETARPSWSRMTTR